jgi:hypothetical protein
LSFVKLGCKALVWVCAAATAVLTLAVCLEERGAMKTVSPARTGMSLRAGHELTAGCESLRFGPGLPYDAP